MKRLASALVLAAGMALAPAAVAQPNGAAPAAQENARGHGVAVVATNGARDDAFALARAVYGGRLRPEGLDEVRARVLAGDPAPPNATRTLVELAEIRGAAKGDDAASRRLYTSIGKQVGAEALLVVAREPEEAKPAEPVDPDAEEKPAPSASRGTKVTARLFLVDAGEFDAARYEPDGSGAPWRATVTSLEQRFPNENKPVAAPSGAGKLRVPEDKNEGGGKAFYSSPWFWGALGAAVVLGGAFFLATRDSDSGTTHLQMRAPR